jgi:hypothetical protein
MWVAGFAGSVDVGLVSLPWFRAGFIPDELRWELIQQLKPEQERDVRSAIIGILEKNQAVEGSFASETQLLEIAINRVRRQLFFWVDDNYFSLSTTTTF